MTTRIVTSMGVRWLIGLDRQAVESHAAALRLQGQHASRRTACVDCGVPFSFEGLPLGLNVEGAAMSPDGCEARLAISPGVGGAFGPKESDDG